MKKTRIIVFGTFDCLHPGHLDFFKQARSLSKNPHLMVSIARDVNVKRIKGINPQNTERDRLAVVASCRLVDEAVLGGIKDYLSHIISLKPNIIALGYDQHAYIQGLESSLIELGFVVKVKRLKSYKPQAFKTSKLLK